MRYRHDRYAKSEREPRAAGLVVRARPRANPGAFRIDDDPETLRETLAPLLGNLLHCVLPRLAVDRDRRGEREGPAEERYRKQLLLGDEGQRGEQKIQLQGLPGRRVLGHDDMRRGARRDVLHADDAMADAADPARAEEHEPAPADDEPEPRQSRQPEE